MSSLICTVNRVLKSSLYSVNLLRNFSKITITDDRSTFVVLHPEKKVPYELTQPIPDEKLPETNSVLKMDDIKEVMRVFKDVSPETAREQLMKMTLTTKHRWFPRGVKSRKLKKLARDRPYL